jgi:hypothetical protein
MTVYSPSNAAAYLNWGRWVADCPDGCNSAERFDPGQDAFVCSNCGCVAPVAWPDNPAGIWSVLGLRILERHRNWYPAGHPVAVAAGIPHGQTVTDLMAETLAHENDTEV